MHVPTPFRTQSYEHDEYPTHSKADMRLYGSDDLCYGILFGGDDCYPDIDKIRNVQASIAPILNSHEALIEAIEALLYEPMSERAVDQAKKALKMAKKGA